MKNRSIFTDLLAFLSSIRGDLSNITAPPFFLAPLSVVELPSSWTERPSLFAAIVKEPDAQKRALLVLRWMLCSLKSQVYVRQDVKTGLRKPLNAFLGELFFGQWTDDTATARIISEQVSHHPPVTACYMWDDENGIRGDGYTRVEMSFSGSLNIKQTGHALLHLDKFNEDYLIPFPDFRVKGFLSGALYPELVGTYQIISSTGFISEITFSGTGLFSGQLNSFEATTYQRNDPAKTPIYLAHGQWSSEFTIHELNGTAPIETCTPDSPPVAPLHILPLVDQDPWETRNAWQKVFSSMNNGSIHSVVREKSKVEEAQRVMRKNEAMKKTAWEPKFFSSSDGDTLFETLTEGTRWKLHPERTVGVWRFDRDKAKNAVKPYHGGLTPLG